MIWTRLGGSSGLAALVALLSAESGMATPHRSDVASQTSLAGHSVDIGLPREPQAPRVRLAQRSRKSPVPAPEPAPPPLPLGPAALDSSGAVCAATYHRALSEIHSSAAPRMSQALPPMTGADPTLAGMWLFADPSGKASRRRARAAGTKTQRVCVQEVTRRGRMRCLRFENRPLPPPPLAQIASAPPTAEEARVLRFLDETVRNKGSLVEFGGNGRYKVMTERIVADLRLYATQPQHPALCSGLDHMMVFYKETLAPLRKRMQNVTQMRAKSGDLARDRHEAALAAIGAESPVPRPEPASEGMLSSKAPLPPRLPGASALGGPVPGNVFGPVIGKISVATGPLAMPRHPTSPFAMTADLAHRLMAPDLASALAREADALVALRRLHGWLASSAGQEIVGPQREAVLASLRMIETAAYLERMQVRYDEIDAAILATLIRVEEAHKRACTCGS